MDAKRLSDGLERLASQPGIVGCALVDADTGLVWHARGTPPEGLWEAAVDYWRLHGRQHKQFETLGALRAAVMYHQKGMLVILPCLASPPLLLVGLGPHKGVDWRTWQTEVDRMGGLIGK